MQLYTYKKMVLYYCLVTCLFNLTFLDLFMTAYTNPSHSSNILHSFPQTGESIFTMGVLTNIYLSSLLLKTSKLELYYTIVLLKAMPLYTPTNSVKEGPFPYTVTNTGSYLIFKIFNNLGKILI